jgi:hypothetical protein
MILVFSVCGLPERPTESIEKEAVVPLRFFAPLYGGKSFSSPPIDL